MRRAWTTFVIVCTLLVIAAPTVSEADLDASTLLGNWSGTWETIAGGGLAGRGAAEFIFQSLDGDQVKGKYRLTRSGVPTRGAGFGFIDNEIQFSGRASGDTIVIPPQPSIQQPRGTLTVAGTQMTGQLGQIKIELKKK